MTDLLRPGDTPPTVRSQEALEELRPDELEGEVRRHREFVKRLEKEGDPGAGKPLAEAQAVRQQHLQQLQRHVEAAQTAETVLGPAPDSKEAERERWAAAHAGLRTTGQPLSALDPTMQQFYLDKHQASQEAQVAREQKRQEAEEADRAAHPPAPQALSIAAAVLADDVLIDFLEVKPTKTSVGDVQTISALEVVDVAVLGVTLRLLEERRPLAFRELGQGGKWPQRTPPIASTRGLGESLSRLRFCGFLTLKQGSVDYGAQVLRIAAKWGIAIDEKEAGTG